MLLTHRLIDVVKKYSILYDLSDPDYKNIRKKNKLWKQLGVEMDESGNRLKKRWRNLKDSYNKHLKANQSKTNDGVKKNYKNWQWAKKMEYFRAFMPITNAEDLKTDIEIGPTTVVKTEVTENSDCDSLSDTSMENQDDDEEELDDPPLNQQQIDSTTCFLNTSTSPPPRKFDNAISNRTFSKEKFINKQKEPVNNPSRISDYLQNDRITEIDPTELILLGYAKTIKTFSPQRQAITKLKFAQIIMEQECEHFEEQH